MKKAEKQPISAMAEANDKELKYEEAFAELQEIVRKMEGDEPDLDRMSELLKRAQQLIKLCKDKLTKTDEEIRKILADS